MTYTTMKKGVYYYALSIILGRVCWGLIEAHKESAPHVAQIICSSISTSAVLIATLPLLDAAPVRLISQRVRGALLMAMLVYHAWVWVSTKLATAEYYSNGHVPELGTGLVVVSSLGLLIKTYVTISLLLCLMLYRLLRFPRQAILLAQPIPFTLLSQRFPTGTRRSATMGQSVMQYAAWNQPHLPGEVVPEEEVKRVAAADASSAIEVTQTQEATTEVLPYPPTASDGPLTSPA